MAWARMEAKEVRRIAKDYVTDLLSEEQIRDIATEEIKYQHGGKTWLVTIGFCRPWQKGGTVEYPFDKDKNLVRSYKAVRINDLNGHVKEVIDRLMMEPFDPADEFNDTLDAKEVVERAREHFHNFFDVEGIGDVGLEEVKFDYESDTWEITFGFCRISDNGTTSPRNGDIPAKRCYKAICIDYETGRFQGVKDRFITDYSPSDGQ